MKNKLFQSKLFLSLLLIGLFISVFSQPLYAQPGMEEQLALQYYQNEEYSKAAELFEKLYNKNPGPYFYNYYLNSLHALKDYEQAEQFIRKVGKQKEDDVKYLVELGYNYQLSGDKRKAEKTYKKCFKSLNNSRASYVHLSNAFRARSLYDYALEVLEKGGNRFEPPLQLEMADLYLEMGEYQKMIASYLDLIHNKDDYINLVKGKFQLIMADASSGPITMALRKELLQRTDRYPNKSIYAELLYWYSVQKREFEMALLQAKALDKQFSEQGERVFQLANILLSNKNYSLAIEAYTYILNLGKSNKFYISSEVNLLHARFKAMTQGMSLDTIQIKEIVQEYNRVLEKYGKNRTTIDLMRNLAQIQAFWLHNTSQAEKLLNTILNLQGTRPEILGEVKLELGDVLLFSGKKWSASLLYKQVEKDFKNDPLGFKAKYKAAQFFYFVGEMEWAKVQLDVLKGATSKLIANDAMELSLLIQENIDDDSSYTTLSYFARADLLTYQKKYQDAFKVFDTIEAIFPGHNILPNISFRRAEIYEQLNQLDSAKYFYLKTVSGHPFASIADNALIQLARIYDQEKKFDKALEAYEQILLNYPGSLFTIEARKRFNELKQNPTRIQEN
jgi:tetratricopeptide (TPR) repeat protein